MTNLTQIAPSTNAPALVPVYLGQIGGIPAHVVNARELHTFLGNERQFADWIKDRIEKYGFVQDQDFALVSQKSEIKKGRGGDRRSKDYHLSLDMAKELSMVENNERGREARRYFIAMERQALEAAGQVVPASHVDTLTPSEQQTLKEIVDRKLADVPLSGQKAARGEIWKRMQHKFRIAKYSQLPRTQLTDAIIYLTAVELRSAPSAPAPAQAPALEYVTHAQLDAIARRISLLDYCVHTRDAARQAAYAHLRRQFGLEKGIATLLIHQADDALAVAAEIERIGWAFKGIVIDAERQLYRHILRNCHPFVVEEWQKAFEEEVAKLTNDRQSQLDLLGMVAGTTTH